MSPWANAPASALGCCLELATVVANFVGFLQVGAQRGPEAKLTSWELISQGALLGDGEWGCCGAAHRQFWCLLTHLNVHGMRCMAGHDSLLQQKRLASLPAPVRRHNPKSLNRFDIAATCDLNENEEEGQDEEEMQPHVDEAEQQALQSMSLSPRGVYAVLASSLQSYGECGRDRRLRACQQVDTELGEPLKAQHTAGNS